MKTLLLICCLSISGLVYAGQQCTTTCSTLEGVQSCYTSCYDNGQG